jgi:predicted PurR-regulated permease PerM
MLIWAVVIAIVIYPIHTVFARIFRGRKILSIVILTSLLLSLIIMPSVWISYSLYEGVEHFRLTYQSGSHLIPPPGDTTKEWPAIFNPVVNVWQEASVHLQDTVIKYSEEVKVFGAWIIGVIGGIGKGILMFNVSIIVAGVLLGYSDSCVEVSKKIFHKLVGKNAEEFSKVVVVTIRNVVKGVLGVAIIQTVFAGLGFFIAGVPFAGLWTVACLVFAIIQLGIAPIAIPVAVYMFSVTDTTTATILAIWLFLCTLADNILKPILLGRNAPAPMMVIFLGAIGGFIFNGFLGLFLGAVILTLGYKLFITWINTEN